MSRAERDASVSNRRGRARRRAASVLAAATLLGMLAVPRPVETEAAWNDAEKGGATFSAITVPAPVSTATCTATSGALGINPQVTVHWRIPSGATGYTSANAQYARSEGGLLLPITGALLGNISTTGTTTAYTTVFSGGLLGGLLGGTMTLAIRLQGPEGWASSWLVATATLPALGGTGTCSLSFQQST